jgi:hypothetical protein
MGVVIHFDVGGAACRQKGKVGLSLNPMHVTCERCLITDYYVDEWNALSSDQRTSLWLSD